MSKRERKIKEVQKKNIKMDYFLRNYFLLDIENNYESVDLNIVSNRINEFEMFLENNNVNTKTHANFIKWSEDLKVILNDLEEKNKNGKYEQIVKEIVKKYELISSEQISKKKKLVDELNKYEVEFNNLQNKISLLKRDIKNNNFLLKKNKVIKNNELYDEILEKIRTNNIELNNLLITYNSLLIKINLIKEDLFTCNSYISLIRKRLQDFSSRLYIINNKNIINNIINRLMPISFDDISVNDVYSGLVIIVTDKEKHKQAYVNPFRIDELNNMYLNMLGEDVRYLNTEKEKNYELKREDDYNEKYKK